MEVADQFWGDPSARSPTRSATCGRSPPHIEDVPPEEMAEQAKAAMAAMAT
jgi:hypothetical protein